ncbi:hypothetical protein AB833_14070 [Chromatiales bacterium (ex Bugula neritina AB1)]|nr:hypothetical protein AB833_14070 [Chromatiales bacterium (ex Bugula neritina AB1)]
MNYKRLSTLVCASSLLTLGGCSVLETVELPSINLPSIGLPDIRFDSNTYIVQPGDTLKSVANRYQIDSDSLVAVNALTSDELIPGQRLILVRDEDTFEQMAVGDAVAAEQLVLVPAVSSGDAILKSGSDGSEKVIGIRDTTGGDVLLNDEPVFVSQLPSLPPSGDIAEPLANLPDPTLIDDIRVEQTVAKVERPEGMETIVGQSGDADSPPIIPLADTVAIQDDINVPAAVKRVTVAPDADGWNWPALGKITREFDLREINRQGLDIDAGPGAGVQAAADGEVVYSGRDLASYGNLVILRHKDNFLTAYSKVSDIYVKENQTVKAGDLIAVVGSEQSDGTELHFEIRRNGEPVNPVDYLPSL